MYKIAKLESFPLKASDVTCSNSSVNSSDTCAERPRVEGKFLYVGDEKFWIRGVTYGTFHPNVDWRNRHPLRDSPSGRVQQGCCHDQSRV